MNTMAERSQQPNRRARPSGAAAWFADLRMPLEIWSGGHRLALATAIAAAVFCAGVYGLNTVDLGRTSVGEAALVDVEHRLSAARAAIAKLPALRAEMAHAQRGSKGHVGASLGNWSAISALASQSGLLLETLEPAPARGEANEAMRPMHVAAHTNFAGLLDFLQGLPSLPMLVVPADLRVKREAGDLSVSMTLQVFDALPPLRAEPGAPVADPDSEDDEPWFFDPFAAGPVTLANTEAASQLVGVLHEGRRALALLAAQEGAMAVEAGQSIGREKVTRIDERRVTLESTAGTRVLTLAEVAR